MRAYCDEAFCIHVANNLIQFLLALLTSNLKKSPSLSLSLSLFECSSKFLMCDNFSDHIFALTHDSIFRRKIKEIKIASVLLGEGDCNSSITWEQNMFIQLLISLISMYSWLSCFSPSGCLLLSFVFLARINL
jgi:hypothetical protein